VRQTPTVFFSVFAVIYGPAGGGRLPTRSMRVVAREQPFKAGSYCIGATASKSKTSLSCYS